MAGAFRVQGRSSRGLRRGFAHRRSDASEADGGARLRMIDESQSQREPEGEGDRRAHRSGKSLPAGLAQSMCCASRRTAPRERRNRRRQQKTGPEACFPTRCLPDGAGDGNRTRVMSLEGSGSAIELHPHDTSAIVPQHRSSCARFPGSFHQISHKPDSRAVRTEGIGNFEGFPRRNGLVARRRPIGTQRREDRRPPCRQPSPPPPRGRRH